MIVSYICCHEVSDHHTGMGFHRWKNKWKLSGNNRSTVSWNLKNNNPRPSVIQAENSFFLSLCCAWADMTWTLSPEATRAGSGTQKRQLPPLLKCPERQRTLPLQRVRVTFHVLTWSTFGEDRLRFVGPRYRTRGRPSSPDWRLFQDANHVWRVAYSEDQWVFFMHDGLTTIWSSGHYPYTHLTDGKAAAKGESKPPSSWGKVTVWTQVCLSDPTALLLAPHSLLPPRSFSYITNTKHLLWARHCSRCSGDRNEQSRKENLPSKKRHSTQHTLQRCGAYSPWLWRRVPGGSHLWSTQGMVLVYVFVFLK